MLREKREKREREREERKREREERKRVHNVGTVSPCLYLFCLLSWEFPIKLLLDPLRLDRTNAQTHQTHSSLSSPSSVDDILSSPPVSSSTIISLSSSPYCFIYLFIFHFPSLANPIPISIQIRILIPIPGPISNHLLSSISLTFWLSFLHPWHIDTIDTTKKSPRKISWMFSCNQYYDNHLLSLTPALCNTIYQTTDTELNHNNRTSHRNPASKIQYNGQTFITIEYSIQQFMINLYKASLQICITICF